jgi:hypothetical protein
MSHLLFGRRCEGIASKNDPSHFRVTEIKQLNRELGLPELSHKDDLCNQIRNHLSVHPELVQELEQKYGLNSIRKKKQSIITSMRDYTTLEEMMIDFGINDMRSLIDLTDQEMNSLINQIELHEKQFKLSDLVKGKSEDEKIRIFIEEMAGKLCRCIDNVKSSGSYSPSAVCISQIFNKKGTTISRYQCRPTPLLIPKTGNKSVIRHYVKK